MDKNEIAKERRLRAAFERLGTEHPVCVSCGENNPHCLEKHHVGGQRYDDLTLIICRNCHRKQSDAQKDHPKPEFTPPDPIENIGHVLLGLADFIIALAAKLKEFGLHLINHVKPIENNHE